MGCCWIIDVFLSCLLYFFFLREITYLIFLCCRAGPGKIIDVGSLQSALSLSRSTASCDVSNGLDLKFGKEGAQRVFGLNFDLCQRHVPGYKLIYHAPKYLRLRATFGASNLFVSLMKAHLVSVSIFYLLSLCSFVSLTVRFIIFATCQFVTYLSDSWSFPHSTSLRVHYAWPGKALSL